MTITEIINEHLAPDWTTNLPDLETLRVLLDRIRDEKGCGLRESAGEVFRKLRNSIVRRGRPDESGWHSRNVAEGLIRRGEWAEAKRILTVEVLFGERSLHALAHRLVSVAESLGLDPNSVPD